MWRHLLRSAIIAQNGSEGQWRDCSHRLLKQSPKDGQTDAKGTDVPAPLEEAVLYSIVTDSCNPSRLNRMPLWGTKSHARITGPGRKTSANEESLVFSINCIASLQVVLIWGPVILSLVLVHRLPLEDIMAAIKNDAKSTYSCSSVSSTIILQQCMSWEMCVLCRKHLSASLVLSEFLFYSFSFYFLYRRFKRRH